MMNNQIDIIDDLIEASYNESIVTNYQALFLLAAKEIEKLRKQRDELIAKEGFMWPDVSKPSDRTGE